MAKTKTLLLPCSEAAIQGALGKGCSAKKNVLENCKATELPAKPMAKILEQDLWRGSFLVKSQAGSLKPEIIYRYFWIVLTEKFIIQIFRTAHSNCSQKYLWISIYSLCIKSFRYAFKINFLLTDHIARAGICFKWLMYSCGIFQ